MPKLKDSLLNPRLCCLILALFMLSPLLKGQNNPIPVAKFTFNDGLIKDDIGNLNPKAYNVDFEEDRFGNPGKALYFRGNLQSYLNLGTSSRLKPKAGSISVWLNCQGTTNLGDGFEANPIIWTRSNLSTNCNSAYSLGIDLNTQKLGANTLNSCVDGVSVYAKNRLDLGTWYHVVITFDQNYLSLYINGQLQRTIDKKFEMAFVEGDSVNVGCYNDGKNKRFFLGRIDDIEIFNQVLSSSQILQLYKAPNPDKNKTILGYIINGTIILLLLIVAAWLVRLYIRRSIKSANEKNQLLQKGYEQDIKVLKAQMNPHFVFNALNSIQQFIVTQENEKALTYLAKFSRLLRKTMESNTGESINLLTEIEILMGYLEIESLRFNGIFQYILKMDENLKDKNLHIPSFLIQPLVENAVWHGLLPKEGEKKLFVFFEMVNEKTIKCSIEDNGIGRKQRAQQQSTAKSRSLAIDFIRQRLELLSKMKAGNYFVEITDLLNESGAALGTKVVLTIPVLK